MGSMWIVALDASVIGDCRQVCNLCLGNRPEDAVMAATTEIRRFAGQHLRIGIAVGIVARDAAVDGWWVQGVAGCHLFCADHVAF